MEAAPRKALEALIDLTSHRAMHIPDAVHREQLVQFADKCAVAYQRVKQTIMDSIRRDNLDMDMVSKQVEVLSQIADEAALLKESLINRESGGPATAVPIAITMSDVRDRLGLTDELRERMRELGLGEERDVESPASPRKSGYQP